MLPVVNVGVLIDGDRARNPEIEALFQTEIVALNRLDFDMRFPDDKRIVGDWTVETVSRNLDLLLADPEVDMVIAVGVLASSEAVTRRDLPKPLIAPFIVNYEFQGAPYYEVDSETLGSGVPNLSYLTTPWEAGRDLEALYEVLPFTKVAVFVDGRMLELSDVIADNVGSVAAEYGVGFQIIPVINDAQPALDALDSDVDAVMVNALLNMPEVEVAELINGINERRLPSMALFGRQQVEQGLLFGVAPDTNFRRVARRVAIHTQSILSRENAGDLSIRSRGSWCSTWRRRGRSGFRRRWRSSPRPN